MFGHLPELIIIMVIALIVFGPEKLPEAAASAGKMIREVRQALDGAMNPVEEPPPDDFSTYYYESLARSGESGPEPPDSDEAAEIWPHLDGSVAGTEGVEASLAHAEMTSGLPSAEPGLTPEAPLHESEAGLPAQVTEPVEKPPTR